jgi:hypothetical protein
MAIFQNEFFWPVVIIIAIILAIISAKLVLRLAVFVVALFVVWYVLFFVGLLPNPADFFGKQGHVTMPALPHMPTIPKPTNSQ